MAQPGGQPLLIVYRLVVTPFLARLTEQRVELVPGGPVPVIYSPTDPRDLFVDVDGVEMQGLEVGRLGR